MQIGGGGRNVWGKTSRVVEKRSRIYAMKRDPDAMARHESAEGKPGKTKTGQRNSSGNRWVGTAGGSRKEEPANVDSSR